MRNITIRLCLVLLLTFALQAAISPAQLFTLSPAQATQADDLETALDLALTQQANPGETAFVVKPANDALDNDALVRAEVAGRYIAASWTRADWQEVAPNDWRLILIE